VTESLFSAGAGPLAALAAASKLLPVGVVATIAERIFGAVLVGARGDAAGPGSSRSDGREGCRPVPGRDRDRARPSTSARGDRKIPPAQIAAVTKELVKHGEYVTMGPVRRSSRPRGRQGRGREMNDGSLLQVAFVLENKASFSRRVELLSTTGSSA